MANGTMTPDPAIKTALTDFHAVALTMYGEGRGDRLEGGTSVEERIAVGCVIRNRLKTPGRFGSTYRAVCLTRSQFSCWWTWGGKDNYAHVMVIARALVEDVRAEPELSTFEHGLWTESLFLADGIIGEQLLDSVRGSTHYYAPRAMKPAGRVPAWAVGNRQLAKIGGHLFFKAG